MSVTTLDTLSWLQSPTNLFVVSFLGLFALSLGSLKLLFGTFSFLEIYDQYKTRKALSEKYLNLFTARDNLMYHISWAKARGDNDEAIALSKDLVKLDKEIDTVEFKCKEVFGSGSNLSPLEKSA